MIEVLRKISDSDLKIAVIGDSMLDEYFDVSVQRISPEFPIPVMHSHSQKPSVVMPGGAANVAYQLKNLNQHTRLVSFLDEEAYDVFSACGLDTSMCVDISPHSVPRKRRFYSGDFPTYRWDVEMPRCGMTDRFLANRAAELYDRVVSADFDVVIFSDYDKGVFCSDLVSGLCSRADFPVRIVDPKRNLARWRGCTLIKPNASEAQNMTSEIDLRSQIAKIRSEVGSGAVVVTEGGSGFTGFDGEFFQYRNPSTACEANSVIGAGDCFLAFLGLCLGNGVPLRQSCEFAFAMGAEYVTDKHNKPLCMDRIRRRVCGSEHKMTDTACLARRDFKLVVANGCFDILHPGHISLLEFAKRQGDKLLVAVNSDASVSRLKPGRPVCGLAHRMRMIAALECVDFVTYFEEDDPERIMSELKPDVIVKGMDYEGKRVVGAEHAKSVVLAPLLEGFSTTGIISRIGT